MAGTPKPNSCAETNWEEPANMMNDIAWAAEGGKPAAMARMP